MTRAAMLAGLLVVATVACSRRAPLTSCADNLRGVYTTAPGTGPGTGADGGERWMILDSGTTLEAYPLFPDVDGPRELEIAPRRIDLTRAASALAGTVHRRYMRRADLCDAQLPVHVTRCAGDTLELVLADPAPPLGFAPCSWPGPAPSHLVRWQRE
ncbi:MAG TPA: hypothetical protein VHW23_40075 [Kofleriaceae bacterium]|jgi:hypothetical protein|nr:hypothetical protein [Kofleriaceae bacterium]